MSELGQKPATIWLEQERGSKKKEAVDVEANDGYLFARMEDGEVHYYPWHRVHEVHRDV